MQEALRLHQLHHPHVVALLGVTIAGSTGACVVEGGKTCRATWLAIGDNGKQLHAPGFDTAW